MLESHFRSRVSMGEVRLKNKALLLISAILLLLIKYGISEIYGKLDPIF